MKIRTVLQSVFFLAFGLFLFYWAMSDVSWSSLWLGISNANMFWVAAALLCGGLSHLARSLRWNLLLRPMGYKAREAASFHAVIIGYLVNMAVPRLGEVTRPAALSRMENIPFNKLIGTVVAERVVDLLMTLIIAVLIILLQFDLIIDYISGLFAGTTTDQMLWFFSFIGLFIALGVLAIYYRQYIYTLPLIKRFKGFFEGIVDGIKSIVRLKNVGLFLVYSFMIWLMYFMMPYLILFALDGTAHLGVSAGLTILLFGTIAMIIPVPGGIGTFEILVPAGLALYAITGETAETYTILTHGLQVVLIFCIGIWSIVYFIIRNQNNKKNAMDSDNRG